MFSVYGQDAAKPQKHQQVPEGKKIEAKRMSTKLATKLAAFSAAELVLAEAVTDQSSIDLSARFSLGF